MATVVIRPQVASEKQLNYFYPLISITNKLRVTYQFLRKRNLSAFPLRLLSVYVFTVFNVLRIRGHHDSIVRKIFSVRAGREKLDSAISGKAALK